MAETPSKRPREETRIEDVEETKRHKSYNHILSLLELEEEEPTQDLSSLIITLQQELSSESAALDSPSVPCQATENEHESNPTTVASRAAMEDSNATSSLSPASSCSKEDDEDDDRQKVIRHLLEASDDELGIPNIEATADNGGYRGDFDVGNGFALCDGLWELEDEAANYYTLLQSELFM